MNTTTELNRAADNIRILAAAMVEKAKSGHPGGAMGGADFINVLYAEFLEYDPQNPQWEGRDRFFLDPGHMSPMLYSVLALSGKFQLDDLKQFRQWQSITPGHPERDVERGIENTSGPLGQGHTCAVGAAIAAKFLKHRFGEVMNQTIYTYISDGGIQEEVSQGAGRIAGHLGLNNLIMFYDANTVQLSTYTDEVMSEDIAMKYRAWGWNVIEIDGNNVTEIRISLKEAKKEKEKPTLIIGNTVMGKGAVTDSGESYENMIDTHGQPIGASGADFAATVNALGGNAEEPFVVFEETKAVYQRRHDELVKLMKEKKTAFEKWKTEQPEAAKKMEQFFSGKLPTLNWESVEQKPNQATRVASSTVLSYLAERVENMVVSSADLSNSDKTDGFLKKTTAFKKNDFSGKFLQAGVSELTMACVANGIALHGGLFVACGTFFVFSDYMKPAVRMATLMELPIKYIWSHDAFRVGEDGPTHEPVEQEAQIRLMEKLKNHSGNNSMLVLRPADVEETTVAWKMAMDNMDTPTALILSRQNINNVPGDNRKTEARKANMGAYIVQDVAKPDVVLLASGSEVSTLIEGAELLRQEGIKCRIVSVPSEGLFRTQSAEYQQSVLPEDTKKFGLTAGLPVNLEGLVGKNGSVWGLESFGYSAPYKILDEKLGFTAQNVLKQVKKLLGK